MSNRKSQNWNPWHTVTTFILYSLKQADDIPWNFVPIQVLQEIYIPSNTSQDDIYHQRTSFWFFGLGCFWIFFWSCHYWTGCGSIYDEYRLITLMLWLQWFIIMKGFSKIYLIIIHFIKFSDIESQSQSVPGDVPSNYASHKKRLKGSKRSQRDLSKVSGNNVLKKKWK